MDKIWRYKYSFSVALVIIFLSFSGPGAFQKIHIPPIPYLDKAVHLAMYFSFMFVLLAENRQYLTSPYRYLLVAVLPFFMGLAIELLQSMLTRSRSGDLADALFNLAGIVLASLAWMLINRHINKKDQI